LRPITTNNLRVGIPAETKAQENIRDIKRLRGIGIKKNLPSCLSFYLFHPVQTKIDKICFSLAV
ncbi:MAG: hypothetical protein OEY34_10255, partial [Cyclobacteriaceae bacterium]|nr:hypothetical protein [Cyclobacteriaceae bacterium]